MVMATKYKRKICFGELRCNSKNSRNYVLPWQPFFPLAHYYWPLVHHIRTRSVIMGQVHPKPIPALVNKQEERLDVQQASTILIFSTVVIP